MTEATEHLTELSDGLVKLEKAAREGASTLALVDGMFRHVHSVKGMAASMGFETISALAHRTEDLVGAVRKSKARIDSRLADLLLAAVDTLQAMVAQTSGGPPAAADPALLARLEQAAVEVENLGVSLGDAQSRGAVPAELRPESDTRPLPAREEPALDGAPVSREALVHLDMPASGRRAVAVEIEISGTCPVPAVRGFLVLKKLGGFGTVLRSTPSLADLKAGRIPDRKLSVVLESNAPLQSLERLFRQISDISAVALRELESGFLGAPLASREEGLAADQQRSVRVKTELLDYFLDAVGELILATARLREVGKMIPAAFRPTLDEGVDRLHGIVKDLHDKVMAVRMTPLGLATDRLPRMARDLARKTGKQVEVEVRGSEIEIDRAILEGLGDPLLHLLRNAVDHGIEPPHLRLLAGKPATGRISVTARRERDRVILEIADDGKGMEPDRLRAQVVALGTLTTEQAAALSDKEALMLACLPGVSTADLVTDVSGRGVGMDSVKRTIEGVGGMLDIETVRGTGTRFILSLPLTVAVQPVLLVLVGEEILGLPIAKVHGAARVETSKLETSQGTPLLAYGASHIPIRELGALLGFPTALHGPVQSVVVAESDSGRIGLAVDALIGQQEVVLKPLSPPLDLVAGLSAVTILGNGRPIFILDIPRLLAA